MKLHTSIIPEEIFEAYNLSTVKDNNGWVYIKYSVMIEKRNL